MRWQSTEISFPLISRPYGRQLSAPPSVGFADISLRRRESSPEGEAFLCVLSVSPQGMGLLLPHRGHCHAGENLSLPLTREVAKPQVLTEGEKIDVLQNLRFFSPSVCSADSFPHWGKCRAQRGDRGHGPPCAKSSGRAFALPEPRCGSTFPLRAFRGR